jgi:hypothetical protein
VLITVALLSQLTVAAATVRTAPGGVPYVAVSPVVNRVLIAADPHGPDPHGDDPHDEKHDDGLPANADRKIGKAPEDPYGGQVPKAF